MLYSSYQDTVKMGFVERKGSTVLLDQYYNHNADIAVEAQKWTQVSWSFESPVDLYADVNGQTPNALYVILCGSAIPEAGSYWRMKNIKIEFGNKATDWTPAPEDVEAEITESKTYAKGLVDTLGTTLQNQIDGVVDSYFMEGAPTTTNAPAKDWTTDTEKARHEGDTYTNIQQYTKLGASIWEQGDVGTGTTYNGKAYAECKYSRNLSIRTKELITNQPSQLLYIPSGYYAIVCKYDSDGLYLGSYSTASTLPTDAAQIAIVLRSSNKNNITPDIADTLGLCINPDAGKSWRWCNMEDTDDSTWHWHEIADSDAVRALQNAAKAQDTADGKRRVFVTTPYTPYDIGDLWAQGGDTNQDILKCKVARATGNYVASDWESASSALQAAQNAQAAVDNMEIGGENLYYLANPLTQTATSTNNYYYYILLENLELGKKYTFSCEKSVRLAGTATKYTIRLYNFATNTTAQYYDLSIGNTRQTCTFTVPAVSGNYCLLIYAGVGGSTAGNSLQWTDTMIQKGDKTTAYQQPAWKPLYNQGISISYEKYDEAVYKDLLYNIPAGTYKATIAYESKGDGAGQDVSGAYANSCIAWYKAGSESKVIAITDWGETVHIEEAADVVVYTGVKAYITEYIAAPGTLGVFFPAAGTWSISAAHIITYVTDSIAGSAAEAKTKAAALDYLKAALTDGSTQVAGGLLMTNVLMLKNLAGAVTAGMSGLTTKTGTSTADNVLLWGGGSYEEAFYAANNANYYKSSSGTTPITPLIKKDGTGKIGIFKISDTQVEINVPNQGKIIIDGSTTKAGIIMYDTSGNEKLKIIPRSISNSSDIPKAPTTETHASYNGSNGYQEYTNYTYEFEIGDDYLTVDDYNRETTITYNISAYVRATPNQGTTTNAQAQIKLWLQRLDGQGTYNIATISSNRYTINEDEEGDLPMSGGGTFTQVLSSGSVWKLMCSIGRATSTIDVVGYAISFGNTIKWTYLQRYPYTPKVILGLDGLLCANDYEHFFKLYTGAGGGTQQIIMAGLPTSAAGLQSGQLYSGSDNIVRVIH